MHTEFWWGGWVGMGDEYNMELRREDYQVADHVSTSVNLFPINIYKCNILFLFFRFVRCVCTGELQGPIHDWILWQIRVLGTLPQYQSWYSIRGTSVLSIIIIPLLFYIYITDVYTVCRTWCYNLFGSNTH